jgi:hypothetical protein
MRNAIVRSVSQKLARPLDCRLDDLFIDAGTRELRNVETELHNAAALRAPLHIIADVCFTDRTG